MQWSKFKSWTKLFVFQFVLIHLRKVCTQLFFLQVWIYSRVLFSLPHLVSKSSDLQLIDFLSSPSYIIVQSPTQYLPITGHRNVSLPPSLEWHVWSSSGNNCRAVHRSLSSGASVYDCNVGFYLVPYCQPSPPTGFLPITGHRNVSLLLSLESHVWLGRRSIYNTDTWSKKNTSYFINVYQPPFWPFSYQKDMDLYFEPTKELLLLW